MRPSPVRVWWPRRSTCPSSRATRTGGTVHLVVNNQIGFTTLPGESRSTRYPTDIAKFVEAPIFHVNGDDPEAVVHVVDLALRFRQHFNSDAVVDIVCYRQHGHNEGDEPAFTQPLMYQKIQNRPSTRSIYQLQLEAARDISLDESEKLTNSLQARLIDAFRSAKATPAVDEEKHAFQGIWTDFDHPFCHDCTETGAPYTNLLAVTSALTTVPDGFNLNRKVGRRLTAQRETVENRGDVDWALAELLAYGSLLYEGTPVRLSGQDSIRGTFSHRHAAWFDTTTGEIYVPLLHIKPDQARFCVYNSMLSEAAVLGFDYGYSLVEPDMLVIWEAQFGDFANGAQVIIDQFITAAFDKWQRVSGLVMLLPHGYEGQGPEHSNAYLERYLAACAEDNIQVCNLTTPAQLLPRPAAADQGVVPPAADRHGAEEPAPPQTRGVAPRRTHRRPLPGVPRRSAVARLAEAPGPVLGQALLRPRGSPRGARNQGRGDRQGRTVLPVSHRDVRARDRAVPGRRGGGVGPGGDQQSRRLDLHDAEVDGAVSRP